MLWRLPLACLPTVLFAGRSRGADPQNTFVATYLLHFALFTTWPEGAFAEAKAPLVVGLIGRDRLGSRLDEAFRGEKVSGRAVVVKRFRAEESPSGCHLLFVGDMESARLRELLRELETQAVLTLGWQEDFCARGGMVRFYMEKERVRFEVHLERLRGVRLRLHSRVLDMASFYGKPGRP